MYTIVFMLKHFQKFFKNEICYLNEELIQLSLFTKRVTKEEKKVDLTKPSPTLLNIRIRMGFRGIIHTSGRDSNSYTSGDLAVKL